MAVIFFCFFFVTTVTGYQNLANGKRAKQSSTVGDAVASKAVDGNTNPYLDGGSCSSTEVQPVSWWQLDLGHVYSVNRIKITTSKDGPEMSKLYVGLSTGVGKATPFLYHSSAIPVGDVVDVVHPGGIRGRYVYMDIVHQKDYETPMNLTLCEVEIYGAEEQYFRQDNRRGASLEILRHQTRRKLDCAELCLSKEICLSFLWSKTTKECVLYSDKPTNTSVTDNFVGFLSD